MKEETRRYIRLAEEYLERFGKNPPHPVDVDLDRISDAIEAALAADKEIEDDASVFYPLAGRGALY